MALTPFDDVPRQKIFRRLILPSLCLLAILSLSVGIVVKSPYFEGPRGPSAVVPVWQSALNHYRMVGSMLSQMPEVCLLGTTVNDFQKSQCDSFWERLAKSGALALAPFILSLFFILIGMEKVSSLYKRVEKQAEKGKVTCSGVVTNPPDAVTDLFSWLFCLRPITVQLPNKNQMTVYVSIDAPGPMPGETLVCFDAGNVWGEKRHLAMIYAPHIAIVRGE